MPVARQTSQASPKYLTIISATPLARYALRSTAPSRVNQRRRRRVTRFAIVGHLFSEVHDTQEARARVKMKGFERAARGVQIGGAKDTEIRETEASVAQAGTFVNYLLHRRNQLDSEVSERHLRDEQHRCSRRVVRQPRCETCARHFFSMLKQADRDFRY